MENVFVVGAMVTISESHITGDRSYLGIIWRIVAVTEKEVMVRGSGLMRRSSDTWENKNHLLVKSEYEFSDASVFVEALCKGNN